MGNQIREREKSELTLPPSNEFPLFRESRITPILVVIVKYSNEILSYFTQSSSSYKSSLYKSMVHHKHSWILRNSHKTITKNTIFNEYSYNKLP